MSKPDDMQCRALLEGADKHTENPKRCPYEKTRIPDQPGKWSKYCKGHRGEAAKMALRGDTDESDDRAAPVTLRNYQTQRELWISEGDWKLGDPV